MDEQMSNQVSPPPVQQPSKPGNKKLYWTIFVIVAVGAAAGLLYVINKPTPVVVPVVVKPVTQKQSTSTSPSSVATSSPVDTTGWLTYTDSTNGFQIKYPSNLFIVQPDPWDIFKLQDTNKPL